MALQHDTNSGWRRMSNYEDAIGRAQDLIDAGHSAALRADVDKASILASLARVQLELASMYEPQSEVGVEGTDVSAELLVAALADGSLKQRLVEQFEAKVAPDKMRPFTLAGIAEEVVRGVLMGETPPVAEQKLCNVAPAGNDKGLYCGFIQGHAGGHSWAGMLAPVAAAGFTDADLGGVPKVAWPLASEGEFGRAYTCGLINDDGVMCSYPRHHRDWTNPASHSWNQENH